MKKLVLTLLTFCFILTPVFASIEENVPQWTLERARQAAFFAVLRKIPARKFKKIAIDPYNKAHKDLISKKAFFLGDRTLVELENGRYGIIYSNAPDCNVNYNPDGTIGLLVFHVKTDPTREYPCRDLLFDDKGCLAAVIFYATEKEKFYFHADGTLLKYIKK